MLDATATPKELVDALLGEAQIVKTPSGEGQMVWQVWGQATSEPPLDPATRRIRLVDSLDCQRSGAGGDTACCNLRYAGAG